MEVGDEVGGRRPFQSHRVGDFNFCVEEEGLGTCVAEIVARGLDNFPRHSA